MSNDSDDTKEYSRQEIEELKALGAEKPAEVSWGDWTRDDDLSHRQELLIKLAASGLRNKEIAELLNYSEHTVSVLLSKKKVRKQIREQQSLNVDTEYKKRLDRMVVPALEAWDEALKNPQSSGRLDVATKVLDRKFGKAKQEVSVESNELGRLIDLIESERARDVTPLVSDSKEKDEVDKFVEEFAPKNFVVGKRAKNGEGS